MKNLFLDRDGIINEIVIRENKIGSPRAVKEFKIRKEFFNFYTKIQSLNLNLFVVSNQPDIARKLMSQNVLNQINKILAQHFIFKEICYCTHDNSNNCLCRKPKPGLINKLIKKYNLKKEDSIIIGDNYKDIFAGQNAKISTAFLSTSYNKNFSCNPDYTITTLLEIVDKLV